MNIENMLMIGTAEAGPNASWYAIFTLGVLVSLALIRAGVRRWSTVKGKVMACQWLGDQTHVAVDVAGRTVVSASQERVSRATGSDVSLNVAARDLHLFDHASGNAIAHGGTLA